MKSRFTDAAQDSYSAAVEYLLDHNPIAAERFVADVDAALERVQRFPRSGSVLRESRKGTIRQFLVLPYRFFYRVEEDTVLIVAVWHGAQLATLPGEPARR